MTDLPIIPFTKEFLAMLAMSEKEAYALKPVFATRCERVSSTNQFLERALIISQTGTLYLFDTEHKRLTHLLELGQQREVQNEIAVVSDRESDVMQTMCVSIHVEGGHMVQAQGGTSPTTSPNRRRSDTVVGGDAGGGGGGASHQDLVLQFHCGRANVALGFVAMVRHFVAMKGIKKGFRLTVLETDEPTVLESLRKRRGSVALIANRISAAKESLLAPPPEQQQTVRDIARQQRRALERAGEDIKVLPPAVIPTAQEMALQQKRKLKEKLEKERVSRQQSRVASSPQSPTTGNPSAGEFPVMRSVLSPAGGARNEEEEDDEDVDDDDTSTNAGTLDPSAGIRSALQRRGTQKGKRPPRNDQEEEEDPLGASDQTLTMVGDDNAYPMSQPPADPRTLYDDDERILFRKPRRGSTDHDARSEDEDESTMSPKGFKRTQSPGSQRSASKTPTSEYGDRVEGVRGLVSRPSRSRTPSVMSERSVQREGQDAEIDAAPEAAAAHGSSPVTSLLRQMRDQTAKVEEDRLSERASEIARLVDTDDLRRRTAQQFIDNEEEDALIDSLSSEEAQRVVSSILESMESAKDEYLELYRRRAELRQELKRQYGVTLTQEHAMQLSLLVWHVCNGRLTQHFDAAALEASKIHPVLAAQTR